MANHISIQQLALVKKLMSLTFSDNDHEALAALRKANTILRENRLTWTEVLSKTVNAPDTVEVHDEMSIEEQIRRALDEVRGTASGRFAEFLESIEQQFNEKGYLSQGQRKPLFDYVRNLRERRKRDA